MNYGYARVSTSGQELAGQVAELEAAGCGQVIAETGSGAQGRRRPKLTALLQRLQPGDLVTVTRLDRFARSTRDALNLLQLVDQRQAGFRSLAEPWADTTTPAGRLMVTVLSGFAEFDRQMILERTAQGRERARKSGIRWGRPPTLTAPQRRFILNDMRSDKPSTAQELARVVGVSKSTIKRFRAQVAGGEGVEDLPPTPLEAAITAAG